MATGMRIQRIQPGRQRQIQWGCGCGLLAGFAVLFGCVGLYVFGLLTPIILSLAGVDRVGSTDDLLETAPIVPTIVIVEPVPQQRAVFDLGDYGQEIINTNTQSYSVVVGGDGNHTGGSSVTTTVATATFSEAGLLDVCRQRSGVCRGEDSRFRNVRFDLRPGGVVILTEVNAGVFWQRIGVVLRLTGQQSFEVIGVDIDGSTYNIGSLPAFIPADTRATINEAVRDVDRIGNEVLTDLIVSTGGDDYRLQAISIDHTQLTLTLR